MHTHQLLDESYDGHPIYGPFGFAEASGGSIVQLKSGYTQT